MNIFKIVLIVVGIICLCNIGLRAKIVIQKLSEIRRMKKKKSVGLMIRRSLERKKEEVKRNTGQLIKSVVGVLIIGCILSASKEYSAIEVLAADINKMWIAISLDKSPDEIVDPINYQKEVESDTAYIPSEEVIYKSLYYESGKVLLEKETALECIEGYNLMCIGILDDYQPNTFGKNNRMDFGSVILGFIEKKQDGIRSITALSAEIEKHETPWNVPVEIYMEETYARMQAYKRNPMRENAYQTARAAADVVACLAEEHDVYKVLVFVAIAIDYYLETFKYEEANDNVKAEDDVSKNDIYLKISVILEKLVGRSELKEYKPHFRYLSNAFLSQIEGTISSDDELCIEQFYYYYGVGRYRIGWNYEIEDKEFYRETLSYLQMYLEQKRQDKEYTKSCMDGAINILKKYPELKTEFWNDLLQEDFIFSFE